jgi:hypothetical protein
MSVISFILLFLLIAFSIFIYIEKQKLEFQLDNIKYYINKKQLTTPETTSNMPRISTIFTS